MRNNFLIETNQSNEEINVFADKSSLILEWVLSKGIERENFAVREVARDVGVSIGLAQKVVHWLVLNGYLKSEGTGTSKKFILWKPLALLNSWIATYSIMKKCRMWTYSSAYQGRGELLKTLEKSALSRRVVRSLHSAAEVYKCENTNLETLELYILDSEIRLEIEELLQLEPKGRGYDVLLIAPYYKQEGHFRSDLPVLYTNPLLTYLDLYHFPLRGREQAEFMAGKLEEIKKIYGWGK